HAHPRTARFKEDIIQAFYDGIKHKPETTFGNVKADVPADEDPHFARGNFCSVIRGSAWRGWGHHSNRPNAKPEQNLAASRKLRVGAPNFAHLNFTRRGTDMAKDTR